MKGVILKNVVRTMCAKKNRGLQRIGLSLKLHEAVTAEDEIGLQFVWKRTETLRDREKPDNLKSSWIRKKRTRRSLPALRHEKPAVFTQEIRVRNSVRCERSKSRGREWKDLASGPVDLGSRNTKEKRLR